MQRWKLVNFYKGSKIDISSGSSIVITTYSDSEGEVVYGCNARSWLASTKEVKVIFLAHELSQD